MDSTPFAADWRFHYGEAPGAEAFRFDDGDWRSVDLPFDYLIEHSFDSRHSASHAYLPVGVGHFRKYFRYQRAEGERVFLEFESIYQLSRVWCNGHFLGFRPNGFVGFEYELTPYLRPGGNVIAVRAEVPSPCCRWYQGGGICREVRLFSTGTHRFVRHGIAVEASAVSASSAQLAVTVETDGGAGRIALEILAPDGACAARRTLPVETSMTTTAEFELAEPQRWTVDSPRLYTLKATLLAPDGAVWDRREIRFGVREIEFTRDDGFHLNGERVPLQGVCLHENFGCLGAANFRPALERQLRIMREMGCNAIRTAHNPPAPLLLELCDEMGFLVMDEAFDEWRTPKSADGFRRHHPGADIEATIRFWDIPETYHGYSAWFDEWAERDLTEMVRRDRHHPSVILWSIGNEIIEQGTPEGAATARFLADAVRRIDRSRPVTAGVSSTPKAIAAGLGEALDVFGINYTPQHYLQAHARYKVLGSETVASEYCRGEYLFNTAERDWRFAEVRDERTVDCDNRPYASPDAAKSVPPRGGFLSDRDNAFMTNYAGTPVELALATQRRCRFSAGEFVWSGFDYLGEPYCAVSGLGWPVRSSHSGLVDTAGFPKDVYYLYQSQWSARPMAYLMPHWTWPDAIGRRLPVRGFTNGDEAELFLNGRSLGVRRFADGNRPFLEWLVEYEPGTLRLLARRHGHFHAEYEVATTGEVERLELLPENPRPGNAGDALCFVVIRAVDAAGRVTPEANLPLRLFVEGAGRLAGVDNGDSSCHDAFAGRLLHLYHGLALAILRPERGASGPLTLTAKTPTGLAASCTVEVAP